MNSTRMRRIKISVFLLTALMLIGFMLPAAAAEIPKHTGAFYVNDFSEILSEESKDHILNVNLDLNRKTGAQVVVVTMESLNGESIETFATDMFRSYGIGDSEKNNGILILVVTGDRELRIEVGYGLEGAISDAKAGAIIDDYMIPYLRDDLWDPGIVNGFDAVIQEICTEYDVEVECNAPVLYRSIRSEQSDDWGGVSFYLGIVVLLIVFAILYKGDGFSGGGTFGGGSRSGGGGGGGFSGGGGSSGGGGASRSF